MSRAAMDVLELLLPEDGASRRERARKVTTFLRLLANDASARRATSVGLVLEQARAELERGTRARVLSSLEDLLVHHLAAARSADSFLSLPAALCDLQGAWSALEELRAELPWLVGVPLPGETALEVVGRLLACLRRVAAASPAVELWEARRVTLLEGPRAGQAAFLAVLERAEPDRSETCRAALAGAVECLLERGCVRRARALLAERRAREYDDRGLQRLHVWVELLADGCSSGAALEPAERVPAALGALRARRREWLAPLAGRLARGACRRLAVRAGRAEVGAVLLAAYGLDEQGNAHFSEGECAPALRAGFDAWCRLREDALREPGAPEHAAVARAEAVVEHGRVGEPPPGVCARSSVLAIAVVPVIERGGEVAGWLRLEFEHHLVPSPAALRELARAWRPSLRRGRELHGEASTDRPFALREAPTLAGDPRREVLLALVEGLGIKTAQRHWWGVVPAPDGPLLVVEGGGALEDWRRRPGAARALRRALQTGGLVRFDEPDVRMALCADSASGVVLPLRHGRERVGVLAIESTRRRDLRGIERLLARASRPWAAELRVAGFRAWHVEHFASDPQFDISVEGTRAWVELVLAAARSREPIALSGAQGTGKHVLARWLHYESSRARRPLVTYPCGTHPAREEELRLFGEAAGVGGLVAEAGEGSLHLRAVERLSATCQARLEAVFFAEPRRGSARLIASSSRPLARGSLLPSLARRLERLELFVPSLADRREELPALIAGFGRRFARELGRGSQVISDEVVACLWRQPWKGNLRELENLVYKLVLCSHSEHIELHHLREVARRFRIELLARCPSREPDAELLECALRVTRNQRGSENKTRAALYLGWDPDTLARLRGTPRGEASACADA